MDFWDFLANVGARLLSELIIKGSPKVKDKLADMHFGAHWENPYYKWLVIENGLIIGITIAYVWAVIGWIGGMLSFTTLSLVEVIISAPLYFFMLRARAREKYRWEDYEAYLFGEALKNGELKFVPNRK